MPERRCAAYGLTFETNFDWSWCTASSTASACELRLDLNTLGRYADFPAARRQVILERRGDDPDQPPIARYDRGDDGHHRIAYADGAEFVIDPALRRVYGVSHTELTLDDLLVYLQGPMLGLLLRLRGVLCLHASAAVVNGRALVVVGDGGMGKSTSAAAFAQLGLPVLTDDVLALADEGAAFRVQPGLPRVLLWPESVAALFGEPEALPRIVSTWEKRYLDLNRPGYRFASAPTELGAIYVLGKRIAPATEPEIRPLLGMQALVELVANTYANDLIDKPLRARELEALGRVVNRVPIRRVSAPANRAAVRRVCEAVLDDFAALPRNGSCTAS